MKKSDNFIFENYETDNLINRRTAIITIAQGSLFSLLAGRLAYLQIANRDNYKILSDKNRITHRLLEPKRGIIYDAQGKPLAINMEKYEAVIIKEETKDVFKSLSALQKILPESNIDYDQIIDEINNRKKFVPVKIIDDLSWQDFSKINANIHKIDGIFPQIGFKRYYTGGPSHAHIVGYITNLDKDEKYMSPLSDLNNAKSGKLGIEKAKDVPLRGHLGNKNIEVNASGREIRELDRIDSLPGENIQLTIDKEIQEYCYKRLNGLSGCIAVTNVNSGEFNALVSSPAYDPNLFGKSISESKWNSLLTNKYKPLINKAISSHYPPGSTIKPFVALAALESGINPNTEVFCDGKHLIEDSSMESGYKTFHCWKKGGHGLVNLTDAIKVSCDVYFYQISRKIGINKIAEVCRRFGLGKNTFENFVEETNGLVPDKNWKLSSLGSPWMVGETLSAGIGQGYFLATSAQLSLALAQLTNGGKKLSPSIFYNNLSKKNEYSETVIADPKYLKIIQRGLDEATNDLGGTSYYSRIRGKYEFGGKTGTSQVRVISSEEREEGLIKNEDLPWEKRDHGLFIGYGPISKPQYSVSVIVEHGGSGSGTAAPIASDVFKFLFDNKLNSRRKNIFDV